MLLKKIYKRIKRKSYFRLKATLRDLRFKEEREREKDAGRRPKGSCVFILVSPIKIIFNINMNELHYNDY